ncbi:MAG TPA: Gfo/Idh/MocA family oxidoreductase [Tepidisphaeraceae bacterium]|nr:Gfo/Idh/MocA family oxidoreductase [Tepidisphaeraceae bacterium]
MSSSARHVLVVGAGSIGERHIRCFLATGRTRVSVVEVNVELRDAVARRYGVAGAYGSLEAATDSTIDAAVIATPAPLHIAQATLLARRGVHVLIEKPLSISMDQVDELAGIVAEKRVIAAVAYVMRAHPAIAAMRAAVASGRFGQPLQLVAVSGQNFPFYRPAYRNTYYARRESGGGAVQDALTHVLNAGQWLAGRIDRVCADAAHLAVEGVDVEDTVHVLARHGELLANYSLNQHQAPNETTITLACERGTVRFESHTSRWRSAERPGEPWVDHDEKILERDVTFVRQADGFLDAIEGKSSPLCTLEEGAATLRTNLAILQSIGTGQWVSTGDIR